MRIPLSKPATPTSGSLNPYRRQQSVPVLGAGPLSESGIRLVIEQLPTPAATSMQQASGADKESLGSVLAAAHHAAHPHGTANPSEGKKTTSGEKTIFGIVDVDLAAFAGKGKTTRRFLLRGSRTNATIKVSSAQCLNVTTGHALIPPAADRRYEVDRGGRDMGGVSILSRRVRLK